MPARIVWAGGSLAAESDLLSEAVTSGAVIVRRCVDAADLLAAATREPSAIVVLTASVARLDGEIVARLLQTSHAVVGLVSQRHDEEMLVAWRVPMIVQADVRGALTSTLVALTSVGGVWQAPGVDAHAMPAHVMPAHVMPAHVMSAHGADSPPPVSALWHASSPLIAVWGPHGAPGRSCTAIGVADELARSGVSCCLIDADLAAPSLDCNLGVLAETSGLLVSGRQADRGLLTAAAVRASAREIRSRLAVLTGLPAPHRSADIRPSAMRAVLAIARSAFDVVVVDMGATALERAMPKAPTVDHDAQDVSDAVLEEATLLVAVARDTPLGMTRLVRAWHPTAMPAVIGLVSSDRPRPGERAIREAGLDLPVEVIRADERWGRAQRAGATLAEVAPRSRARRGYRRLADRALDVVPARG